jgi:hypothetical protein
MAIPDNKADHEPDSDPTPIPVMALSGASARIAPAKTAFM